MKTYLIFAALFASLTGFAMPLKWQCNFPDARAQTFSVYHGETVTFEPVFRINGVVTNLAIESIYYQTNGMASAWWKLDGNVFAPSNDVGAASYRFFIDAVAGGGKNYRANGTLKMLHSPGFTANTITPPVQILDFAAITVSNAPFYAATEVDDLLAAKADKTLNVISSMTATTYMFAADVFPITYTANGESVTINSNDELEFLDEGGPNIMIHKRGETYTIAMYHRLYGFYGGCPSYIYDLKAAGQEVTYEWPTMSVPGDTVVANAEYSVLYSSSLTNLATRGEMHGALTNLATKVELAETRDIAEEALELATAPDPDLPQLVTNVVRATQGFVYDEKLGITWKQTMYDGNLYYVAVTNANITEVK